MSQLDKVRIVCSPLSNQILLARFGKDPQVALETRPALDEFMRAMIAFASKGCAPAIGDAYLLEFLHGPEKFKLTLERVE